MKLAFSTNAFRKFSVDEALEAIAHIGFRGCEIMCDAPHAYPPDLTEDDVRRVKEKLASLGLGVSNLNAFMMTAARLRKEGERLPEVPRSPEDFWLPSYIQSEAAGRRARIEHTVSALRLAKAWGAPSISIEPGGPLEDFTEEEGIRRFLEALREIIPVAEEAGVSLGIEPEPGLLIETSDQFLRFMEKVDSPVVGLNLDIGHHFCVGEDPAAVVRKLAPFIRHVHVEDIAGTRVHRHLIPGDGAIDFDAVFESLDSVGYAGWVTVELYPFLEDPHAAAERAYEFLSRYFR